MEESFYVKDKDSLNMTSYMRKMTGEERKTFEDIQEQMQLEVSLQLIAGRDHYAPMLDLEAGTNTFQREAKRVLKK